MSNSGAVVGDGNRVGQGIHGAPNVWSLVSGGGNQRGAGSRRASSGLRLAVAGEGGRQSPSRWTFQQHHHPASQPSPLGTTSAEGKANEVFWRQSFGRKGGISLGWRAVETEEWSLSCFGSRSFCFRECWICPTVTTLCCVVLCCVVLRRVHVRVRHVRVFVLRLVRWWCAGLWWHHHRCLCALSPSLLTTHNCLIRFYVL